MKEKINVISRRRLIVIAAAMLLLLCCIIGGTSAYLSDKTAAAENKFKTGTVTGEIIEEFDGRHKTSIKVANTGSADAFVRVAFVSYYVDTEGNITAENGAKARCDPLITEDWFLGADGFYYCKSKVAGGNTLSPELLRDELVLYWYNNGSQVIEVIAQLIQADGKTEEGTPAVVDAWKVVQVKDGQLTPASSGGTLE